MGCKVGRFIACSVIAFDNNEIGMEYVKQNTAEQTPMQEAAPVVQNVEIEPMETDTQESDMFDPSNSIAIQRTSSVLSKNHNFFKIPTKNRQNEDLGSKHTLSDFSLQRGLSSDIGEDDDPMNVSPCSHISDISVLVAADEEDLISSEEQARRLMSPYGKTRTSPKPSPATPKTGRRAILITLSRPKRSKKIW